MDREAKVLAPADDERMVMKVAPSRCAEKVPDNNMKSPARSQRGVNSVPASSLRRLSAERQFQVFLETEHCERPIGEILSREGLTVTDLARIQQRVRKGALARLRE